MNQGAGNVKPSQPVSYTHLDVYKRQLFTPLTAVVFLVFTLLYTPCVAAISSVRRELGGKWALGVVIMQCVIAWIAAWIVRMIGLILGLG